jgi:ABC-type lipoprotein release transport system permease subunit
VKATGDKRQFKNVDPPFWVAWNQALASIRVRFLRQMITSIGIALGIAFFASMQTLRVAESGGDKSDAQLRWLVTTSLVMCLVGVTNSMLMSVTERFREIGTIKCLGASDSFIVRVFFLEALLLGTAGSLTGSILGVGLSSFVSSMSKNPVTFPQALGVVLLGTLIGIAMTIVAAIAPAIQAAKMPAAAALRVEV